MEKREDALREALENNAAETDRWENYKTENVTAIANLETFSKNLSVDVMVPVGRKAFMPGQLVHTNEVLVGHYQGYFSKCSAHKAKEICAHRIHLAEEQLEKLSTEAGLWQNKLDKPYIEGVLPNTEEREIIEDYDEETEKRWREEHKLRVKQAKTQEKLERDKGTATNNSKEEVKSDAEILQLLEEAEMMQELEDELNKIEEDEVNVETIHKFMSGEVELPAKKNRTAHEPEAKQNFGTKVENELRTELETLQRVVKKRDLQSISSEIPLTNNNITPNPALFAQRADDEHELFNETIGDLDLPMEVKIIKEQARFLLAADQIGFYEYQVEIIKQKLLAVPLRNQGEQAIEEKIRLLTILDNLEDLLEIAEETVGAEELAEQDVPIEGEMAYAQIENTEPQLHDSGLEALEQFTLEEKESLSNNTVQDIKKSDKKVLAKAVNKTIESSALKVQISKKEQQPKRRISFALENQTLEFRRNETVSEMLPKKRDIITLDDEPISREPAVKPYPVVANVADKRKAILDKVEKNLKFVAENQSKQDFDLVGKILDSSMGKIRTLSMHFKHSSKPEIDTENTSSESGEKHDFPVSPGDFYKIYLKTLEQKKEKEPETIFVNSYEGEDQVHTPILREIDRLQAYEDPRVEFSKPGCVVCVDENNSIDEKPETGSTKSILRNKSAVLQEKQNLNGNANSKSKKKKPAKKVDPNQYMSAYYKVMTDVVEKETTEPEPLPKGKFIDANTPKKRVSRFRQMRST